MFVVLNIEKYSKRMRKDKIRKINKSPPLVCGTSRGLPFYLLNVCEERKGIDWNKTAERCGRYASRIVAPRNLLIPDIGSLMRFIPSQFISALVFNSAVQLLKAAAPDPKIFTVTLTDRKGFLASEVCRLLPYSAQVRIITSYPERYAYACAKALDEYGATLIVRSSYEPSSKPDLIVNCDGIYTPLMANRAVITSKQSCGGSLRFIGSGLELSESHKEIIPPAIEATDFAGALAELCACNEYSESVFAQMETSCKKCNVTPEICLKCYIEGGFEPSGASINS